MEESEKQTRELGRDEWPLYFDRLSRQYAGMPVTVELTSEYTGVRTMACHVPLLGITVEQDGRDEEVIQVLIGDSPDTMMTHTVIAPEHVLVVQPVDGADREVEIRCANGSRLLVTFERPGASAARHVPPHRAVPRGPAPGGASDGGPPGPQPGV
jgi:hypothetical protein